VADEPQRVEPVVSNRAAKIMGSVFRIGAFFAIAFFILSFFLAPRRRGHDRHSLGHECRHNLKGIGLALIIYAGDDPDSGYFPDGEHFQRLHEGSYLTNGKWYSCPVAKEPNTLAGESNYVYRGAGLKDTNANPTHVILVHDRYGNHQNWVNLLYLDGHVKGRRSHAKTLAEFRKECEADGDVLPELSEERMMKSGTYPEGANHER
jgi:prepilin-type processing-associated H-X9-DG protein